MQYINYPAKTLMKSSRVVFTMIFGVLIHRKVYKSADYVIVFAMVAGLALFMHADSTSSAVFEPMGVIMLTISLLCDGAISNVSETIMGHYGVGQDEVRPYLVGFVVSRLIGFSCTVHFSAVFHCARRNHSSGCSQRRSFVWHCMVPTARNLPAISR